MGDIYFSVTRGKLVGRRLKVWQMCNNWVTAVDAETNEYANDGQPISIGSTYFSKDDALKVLELQRSGHLGVMFAEYDLVEFIENGKFKRIKYELR